MNGLRYPPEDQKKVEAKIEAGLSASTKEASALLREIHEAIWELNIPAERKTARVMAMFATLTVSLSIKADRVQKWMIALTVAIGIMTLVLLVATFNLIRIASHTDEQIRQIHQIAEAERHHQTEKTDAPKPQIEGVSR